MSRNLIKFLGTCFGIGFSPRMPGTLGAFFGAAVFLVFYHSPCWSESRFLCYTLAVTAYAVLVGYGAEYAWGKKDPYQFILDEVAGVSCAFLYVMSWVRPGDFYAPYVISFFGFVLFRYFDIAKPGFIRKLEKAPGGIGINLDDVASGLITCVILHGGCFAWYLWMG